MINFLPLSINFLIERCAALRIEGAAMSDGALLPVRKSQNVIAQDEADLEQFKAGALIDHKGVVAGRGRDLIQ